MLKDYEPLEDAEIEEFCDEYDVTPSERAVLLAIIEHFTTTIGHNLDWNQAGDALEAMRKDPTASADYLFGDLVDCYLDAEADER